MVNPLAVDHHPQLKSPDRHRKPGLEAIDISSDRRPARLGGDQGFHPGPLTERHFDRVEATQAGEQLEGCCNFESGAHEESLEDSRLLARRYPSLSTVTLWDLCVLPSTRSDRK